jgi:hypothetical protein
MKIGKLYFEDQLLQQRYKMGLGELNEALARLESLPNYEEAKIDGIPVLALSPQGYQVLGRYSGDEVVSSQVLAGFQFLAEEIFD